MIRILLKSVILVTLYVSLCSCWPEIFANLKEPDQKSGESFKIKSVLPIYTNEIKPVTLYEATVPIFFHMQLPKLPDTIQFDSSVNDDVFSPHACNRRPDKESYATGKTGPSPAFDGEDSKKDEDQERNYFCALEKQFLQLSNHILNDLKEQRTRFSQEQIDLPENRTALREKRQVAPVLALTSIVAGFLLRPAISKYAGNLFGTDDEWQEHFNKIRESLIQEHELLLEFEQTTHSFTEGLSSAVANITETLEEQRRDLIWTLRLISAKIHADIIQDSVSSCKTNHLPSSFVPFDLLKRSLLKLKRSLERTYNYTLAIHLNDKELGKYYKLPIADCFFSADKVHVTLNVPVRRVESNWKLYEIVHTKYAFHGQVCESYPQEASYLAQDEGLSKKAVLITNHMLKYCSVFEHQLCMVPQFSKDGVQSLRCTIAATRFPSRVSTIPFDYEQLLKSCSYRCYPSDELIVVQVGPRKIVATNVFQLSYKCGSPTEKNITLGRLGALEIDLDCNCAITLNGNEKLHKPFPCRPRKHENEYGNNSNNRPVFSFTIPISWSHNFTELNVKVESHDELHHHINHNWPWTIPVLNFSNGREDKGNFTVPEKVNTTYGSVLTNVEIWLTVLTVGLISNFVFTIYCFFKLAMVKCRGYELPPVSMSREMTENRPKYHHSLIPSITSNKDEDVNGVFELEEDIQIKRRERTKKNGDESTYQSNRNSVINKLI